MFDRIISLIGKEDFNKIKAKTVLIVGLGGVGGYAMEALARSGIGSIILIDHDKIEMSNLNRQIITNRANIGFYKTDEAMSRINEINKECQVTSFRMFLDSETIHNLDNFSIDYIIDACDTVSTKKLLIDYSLDKNIELISCMGTAKKIDPSKLIITDIKKTSYDPLAKIIRKYVLSLKTNKKIMVVSSTEKPICTKELSSMIFVPATAGLLCASYIIRKIIDK